MKRQTFRNLILVLVGLGFLFSSTVKTNAVSIPNPTADFYVYDEVGVLSSETIDTILSISTELQSKTKAQLVVVIVDSLNGDAIEDVGLSILRTWGIGDAQMDNGVLILIAIEDRESRIEVGYGLEGALNDAKTGRIQDNEMIPSFNINDFDTGILKGYMAIANEIAKEYRITLEGNITPSDPGSWDQFENLPSWVSMGLLFLIAIVLISLDLRFTNGLFLRIILQMVFGLGRSGGGGRGTFGGGGSGGGGGSSRSW